MEAKTPGGKDIPPGRERFIYLTFSHHTIYSIYISHMSKKIYNYDKCFEIAKNHTCSSDFEKENGTAYNVARKNGWIKDYTWFVRRRRKPYTYDEVYEIAKAYTCSSEFQKGNGSAYLRARENGWIKDYTWFERKQRENGYWNDREKCLNAARECETRTEFIKRYPAAYRWSSQNGWYKDYTWFKKQLNPMGYWTKERVTEESRKYKTRGEFHDMCGTAYSKARINKWLDDFTWLHDERIDFSKDPVDCVYAYEFKQQNSVYVGRTLTKRLNERDYEHIFTPTDSVYRYAMANSIPVPEIKILESGLTVSDGAKKEGLYLEEYRKNGWNILNRAKTGSIGKIGSNKWNKDTCLEEAKKYKTRGTFAKGSGGAYDVARRNGWLDDYTWFEEQQKPAGYWDDFDNCYKAAAKCRTKTEFTKKHNRAYVVAKKNDWLKHYTWFNAV